MSSINPDSITQPGRFVVTGCKDRDYSGPLQFGDMPYPTGSY